MGGRLGLVLLVLMVQHSYGYFGKLLYIAGIQVCQINSFSKECGETVLTTSLGLVDSPEFPSDYPNDLDCKWVIIVEEGFQIDLDFAYFEVDPDPVGTTYFLDP